APVAAPVAGIAGIAAAGVAAAVAGRGAAGVAAGIGHEVGEDDVGAAGAAGRTGITGHKEPSILECRGGACLHDILCAWVDSGHIQPSKIIVSSRFGVGRGPMVPSGRSSTSAWSVTAPFTGGTGRSRSSWATGLSFFFMLSPRCYCLPRGIFHAGLRQKIEKSRFGIRFLVVQGCTCYNFVKKTDTCTP